MVILRAASGFFSRCEIARRCYKTEVANRQLEYPGTERKQIEKQRIADLELEMVRNVPQRLSG